MIAVSAQASSEKGRKALWTVNAPELLRKGYANMLLSSMRVLAELHALMACIRSECLLVIKPCATSQIRGGGAPRCLRGDGANRRAIPGGQCSAGKIEEEPAPASGGSGGSGVAELQAA